MNTTRTRVRGSKAAKTAPKTPTRTASLNYGPGGIFKALTKADLVENPILLDMLNERAKSQATS
jgi:hypothetical protein